MGDSPAAAATAVAVVRGRVVNDGEKGRGRWDIVDYEIGSGYGPLNDAENVPSRRRRL